MAAVREKDEWRFAIVEYGGQCVTTAGIKWMLMLSADNWDMGSQVILHYQTYFSSPLHQSINVTNTFKIFKVH